MRYFLDCEFNGFDGPLIAIALVPEGEGLGDFYAVLPCHRPLRWVAEHVMPVLVADWPEDIAHAAGLLVFKGRRMVPHVRFDLINLPGFDTASMSAMPHNALADARALRTEVLTREALALGQVAA